MLGSNDGFGEWPREARKPLQGVLESQLSLYKPESLFPLGNPWEMTQDTPSLARLIMGVQQRGSTTATKEPCVTVSPLRWHLSHLSRLPRKAACLRNECCPVTFDILYWLDASHMSYTHSRKTTQLGTQHWIGEWLRIRKEMITFFQTLAFTPFLLIALLTTTRHDLTDMFLDSNQTSPLYLV